MSSVLKNGISSRPAPLPVRYAAAAAAAVAGTSTSSAPATQASTIGANASSSGSASNGPQPAASTSHVVQQNLHDASVSSPSLTQASVSGPSPMMSSASVSGLAADSSTHSSAHSPVVSEAVASPALPQSLPQTAPPQQNDVTMGWERYTPLHDLGTDCFTASSHSPKLAPSTLPEVSNFIQFVLVLSLSCPSSGAEHTKRSSDHERGPANCPVRASDTCRSCLSTAATAFDFTITPATTAVQQANAFAGRDIAIAAFANACLSTRR